MKKHMAGILCVIALLVLAACSNNTISNSPTATETVVPERSSTPISVTATPTIPLGFVALLSAVPPFATPTFMTPIPTAGTPQPTPDETLSARDEANIKKVIQDYFDLRYYAFSISNLNGIPDEEE